MGSHKLKTWGEEVPRALSPSSSSLSDSEAVTSFNSAEEFNKFLQSVKETQIEEQRREQELIDLRRESSMSWKAAMRADRALFGNYSDQFSYPFLFIVSLLCAIVCSASLFFFGLLLMRLNVTLPEVIRATILQALVILLGNSGSIEFAGVTISASTLLNSSDATKLQSMARHLADELRAESEERSRLSRELEEERELAEAKRKANEETVTEIDEEGRQVLSVGSIKIYDDVLGHGSMGTVVLKGSLNGRPVAVKRMLSQMNSSAEREIALLIKSDGHPNVVRGTSCARKERVRILGPSALRDESPRLYSASST